MKHEAAFDKKKFIVLAAAAVVIIAIVVAIVSGTGKKNTDKDINAAVENSITALKETWTVVYNDIDDLVVSKTFDTGAPEDRKLEIRGVRVIDVNPEGNENYKDVEYVVEFTLYSNRYRTAPYYIPEDIYNSVLVYSDGRCEVKLRNVFKTMADDFRNDTVVKLVEKVYDFDSEYDQVLDLNK